MLKKEKKRKKKKRKKREEEEEVKIRQAPVEKVKRKKHTHHVIDHSHAKGNRMVHLSLYLYEVDGI